MPLPVSDGAQRAADFTCVDHGTVALLTPLTEAAEDWVDCHIAKDVQKWGRGLVIEHRYVRDILTGIAFDGLEVA